MATNWPCPGAEGLGKLAVWNAPFRARDIALGLVVGDAALAHVIFLTGAAMLGLVASLVGELRPAWLVGFVLAAGWVLVVGTYLVAFWTVAGQTPGMRLLRLRLLGRWRFAVLRAVAVAPGRPRPRHRALVCGILPVLADDRRRGLHDLLAGTVVLHEESESQTNTLGLANAAATPPAL